MDNDHLDSQVSSAYCILQAACRFNLPLIRRAAVRWLRQNSRTPTGELLIRLKLAELKELCSKSSDWNKEIDRIVDLYDFITPQDSEQTLFQSPWFYFRNVIIVGAAVLGCNDARCLDACGKHLLQIRMKEHSADDSAKKKDHLKTLLRELSSYNGATDKVALKTRYPLIYQYMKNNPVADLMTFLETFRSTLDPNFCFLESAIEQIRNCDEDDAVIELSSNSRKLGLTLLLEQFSDYQRSLGETQEHLQDGKLPMYSSGRQANVNEDLHERIAPAKEQQVPTANQYRQRRDSRSNVELEPETGFMGHDTRKCKRSSSASKRILHSDEDQFPDGSRDVWRAKMRRPETVNQFKAKHRLLHRDADDIPDSRERAIATARKIQKALDQGIYERWSDNEDEDGDSEKSVDHIIARASNSRSPRSSPFRQIQRNVHPPSANSRKISFGLPVVPSPFNQRHVRRSVGQWQEYEIEQLRQGVTAFGVGQWSQILKHGRFLPGRTSVDLKDKYRNMIRRGLFNIQE